MLKKLQAKDVMTKKVVTVEENTPVEEIIKILVQKNITGVPVVNKRNEAIGMVTEKDIAEHELVPRPPRAISLLGGVIYLESIEKYNEELLKICAQRAKEVMTSPCLTCEENTSLQDLIIFMKKHQINRVPITKKGKLVGMVTRTDILHSLVE